MSLEHHELLGRTWDIPAQTPEGFEEPDVISWAATPLNPYSEHQKVVHDQLEQLFAHPYPEDVPTEFSELVAFDYMAGSAHRETVNYSHFAHWKETYPEEVATHASLVEKAEHSGNCPRELLDFVCTSSVQATELGKLSVPYGYRFDKLADFRQEIIDSIIERDGELLEKQPYTRIHVSPHFTDAGTLRGLITTYQRHIGRVLDEKNQPITITERQALAIRTDSESGFPHTMYQGIMSPDPKKRRAALERVEKEFIQTDAAEKFMVPLSVVTFAHHKKREKESSQIDMPELAAHMAKLALDDVTK